MLTGWIHHLHKLNRALSENELESRLHRVVRSPVLPDGRANLLRMNSVYAEFIDNRFFARGFPALGGAIALLGFLAIPVWGTLPVLEKWWLPETTVGERMILLLFYTLGAFLAFLSWSLVVRKDICTYTYYPIRFNRKTKTIYVFRHNGPNGVLAIPWDKAFFFIGRGKGAEKHLLELRCHALDENGMVVATFGIGHDDTTCGGLLEVWELIRLYMEEGPQVLPQHPVFLFPQKVEWKESWTLMATMLGGANMAMMVLSAPLWAVGTVMHYLTLKTCKAPVWPQEVEDACRIEPNDPYVLPEERYERGHPRYEEVWAAARESRRRNREVREAWEREQRSAH